MYCGQLYTIDRIMLYFCQLPQLPEVTIGYLSYQRWLPDIRRYDYALFLPITCSACSSVNTDQNPYFSLLVPLALYSSLLLHIHATIHSIYRVTRLPVIPVGGVTASFFKETVSPIAIKHPSTVRAKCSKRIKVVSNLSMILWP